MRRTASFRPGWRAPCGALLLLVLAGCDNEITPLLVEPTAFFAVHGFLDSAADTQFVRVEALRGTVFTAGAPLDATVTSTHAQSGTTVTWRDSLVTLDDGGTGHLFYALFHPEAGGRYHLDVRRADGRGTRATTELPPVPTLRIDAPQGDSTSLSQQITLEGLFEPFNDLRLRYRVSPTGNQAARTLSIRYGQTGRRGPLGWDVQVFLTRDLQLVRRLIDSEFSDTTAGFFGVGVEVELPSKEWKMPDASPNIEQGQGFFGAIGRYVVEWHLDQNAVHTMGFQDLQQ